MLSENVKIDYCIGVAFDVLLLGDSHNYLTKQKYITLKMLNVYLQKNCLQLFEISNQINPTLLSGFFLTFMKINIIAIHGMT